MPASGQQPNETESSIRPVPDQGPRFVRDPEQAGLGPEELLDRLEQKAAELSQAQERLEATLAALEAERTKRRRAARALENERAARKAAEAALEESGPGDAGGEPGELRAQLEEERAMRARLEAELEAANLQTAGLQERLGVAWAQLQEAEAQAARPRGLGRLGRKKR